jgi:hypothetical protein
MTIFIHDARPSGTEVVSLIKVGEETWLLRRPAQMRAGAIAVGSHSYRPDPGHDDPAGKRCYQRFASVGDYASYCRMVESGRLSNGKRKGHGNRKCGNRYLCWLRLYHRPAQTP